MLRTEGSSIFSTAIICNIFTLVFENISAIKIIQYNFVLS